MVIRVTAIGHLPGGEEWQNVFHVEGLAAPGSPDLDPAMGIVQTFYQAFNDRLVDSWGLDLLRVSGVTGGVIQEDAVTGLVGEVATAPMPNDCAVLVTWTSNNPSRTGRGRTFLGGWPLSASVENGTNGAAVVDGGPVGAVAAACTLVLGDPAAPLGVYSRPAPDADPPRPIGHFDEYTGGYVSRRWSTQRRRDLETPRLSTVFP